MCGKEETPYVQKWLCGCTVILVVIIIILSTVISIGGGSDAKVELNGDNDSALVEQSSGIHLLEVNGANLGSIDGETGWSWMEYLCVVLGIIFLLNFTHIAHYCLITKRMVNRKVERNVQLELGKLAKAPVASESVIVPGLA